MRRLHENAMPYHKTYTQGTGFKKKNERKVCKVQVI